MAKKKKVAEVEEKPVTRESLNIVAFASRVEHACQRRIDRGAFGGLTFDQVLALTHRKKNLRMTWPELDPMLLDMVKAGHLLVQNKRYYPRQCREAVERQMRQGMGKLLVKSSAEPGHSKPRPDKQLQMFGDV